MYFVFKYLINERAESTHTLLSFNVYSSYAQYNAVLVA